MRSPYFYLVFSRMGGKEITIEKSITKINKTNNYKQFLTEVVLRSKCVILPGWF